MFALPSCSRALAGLVLALALLPSLAFAQAVDPSLWTPNGPVHAILPHGGRIHVGGLFDYVGPATGAALPVAASDGAAVLPYPRVIGEVRAVASDGAGGWFLGGRFTRVGGQPRASLAHVLADGSLASWNPGVSGSSQMMVHALAVRGSVVYVGGQFDAVGGQPRDHIAALDAATGDVLPWTPDANYPVHALATGPGVVYAGGSFGTIGGATRTNVAALDSASGNATPWNPGTDGIVQALIVRGPTLFVGGGFDHVGGQPRANLAAIAVADGAVTAWNPGADNVVLALTAGGSIVYVGGDFDHLGGQVRHGAGSVDVNGFVTGWNPNANDAVYSLLWSGGPVYAGGAFTGIGGQARNRMAALDPLTGLATTWDPGAGGTVRALAHGATSVFAGGSFASIGGETRHNLAALDPADGALLPWNPGANRTVHALAAGKSTIFVGGDFRVAGGQARDHLAEIEFSTGEATEWDPDPNSTVYALATIGTSVYAAGTFDTVDGLTRRSIAEIDAVTGEPTAWNPNPDFSVGALAILDPSIIAVPLRTGGATAQGTLDTLVFAGGTFFQIGGEARGSVAQLSRTSGLATPWNPDAGGWPNEVRAFTGYQGGQDVIVGGLFGQIGGQPRANLARLLSNGTAGSWNPGTDGPVNALAGEGRIVYVGGHFDQAGGAPRAHLAALDLLTDNAFAWNPGADGPVLALARWDQWVYAGGAFREIGGEPHSFLARLTPFSLVDAPGAPVAASLRLRCVPNPVFAGRPATLSLTLPRAGCVDLAVFDVRGRRVATIASPERALEAGPHEAQLDTEAWRAGIYFVRLRSDAELSIGKVVLVD